MSRIMIFASALLAIVATAAPAAQPTEVTALFREGQTFLTWKEDAATTGETYRVYRSAKPIAAAADLATLKPVAEVPEGSSRFVEMWKKDNSGLIEARGGGENPQIIPRLCIEPVGEDNKPKMLPEDVGLLVWTVKEPAQGSFYAVTTVAGGAEDKAVTRSNSCGPVAEKKEPIGAVHYWVESKTDDKGRTAFRDWYILYMDYELWNVDYVGYAFTVCLTRAAFKDGGDMPSMHLDGIGSMNVFAAWYSNYGQEDLSQNGLPTWYFGYGTKANGRSKGAEDVKQPIGNYIQHRIMQAALWARRKYHITDPRFYILGNSMGASGNIGLALAFPKFVTAIHSNEGLTDYAHTSKMLYGRMTRMWASSIDGNYGKVELANPVKLIPFGDPQMDWVLKHDGMNVYDFRNAAKFLAANVDTDFPFLVIGHCHQDGSIPADTQAYPFEKYIKDSRHCFSYSVKDGGHGWGNILVGTRMATLVRWDESRPGFSNVPPVVGYQYGKLCPNSRTYCLRVAWGVKAKPLKTPGGKQVAVAETADSWSMPLVHEAKEGEEQDYFVDITPRNLQALKVKAGDAFTYRITDLDGAPLKLDFAKFANGKEAEGRFKAAGEIVADGHNLLLIPAVPIHRAGCVVQVRRK